MCDQKFYTWAQKINETRLYNFSMQPKTSYIKINNYKVVIPCVTIFLIHGTKKQLNSFLKMQPRNGAKTLNVLLNKI